MSFSIFWLSNNYFREPLFIKHGIAEPLWMKWGQDLEPDLLGLLSHLSIYCLSLKLPFNICSAVMDGIPLNSALKWAQCYTFSVEDAGGTLQEERASLWVQQLHHWSAVYSPPAAAQLCFRLVSYLLIDFGPALSWASQCTSLPPRGLPPCLLQWGLILALERRPPFQVSLP